MVHIFVIGAVAVGVVTIGSAIVKGVKDAMRAEEIASRHRAFTQDLFNAARTGKISPSDLRKLAEAHQVERQELANLLVILHKDMLTNRVEKVRFALESIDHFLAARDTDELQRELPESLIRHAHRVADKLGPDRGAFNELVHGFNEVRGRLAGERDGLAATVAALAFSRNLWRLGFLLLAFSCGLLVVALPELQQRAVVLGHVCTDWFR